MNVRGTKAPNSKLLATVASVDRISDMATMNVNLPDDLVEFVKG